MLTEDVKLEVLRIASEWEQSRKPEDVLTTAEKFLEFVSTKEATKGRGRKKEAETL